MNDPRLSPHGVKQLQTDRVGAFNTAPSAPNFINVPMKKDANGNPIEDDTNNYRNDLLKTYCKDAVNNGYDNILTMMSKWGQPNKNGVVNKDALDAAINSKATDASDAAGQIKYLVCQQADGYIAPPLPTKVSSGNQLSVLYNQAYDTPVSRTFYWISLLVSLGFIGFYLWQVWGTFGKSGLNKWFFYGFLAAVAVLYVIWLILLGTPQCMQGSNDYYDPSDYNQTNIIWYIFIACLILSLILTGIGKVIDKPIVMYIGLAATLVVLFTGDLMLASLWPQAFILAVILLRVVIYLISSKFGQSITTWSVPLVGLYGMIVEKVLPQGIFIGKGAILPGVNLDTLFVVKNLGNQ